jgi:arsenate reductase (thioredoxin)
MATSNTTKNDLYRLYCGATTGFVFRGSSVLRKFEKVSSSTAVNVLFVGCENSGRSLIAEACMRHFGQGKFKAFSCGVPGKTADKPNSWAMLVLQNAGISTGGLQAKDWSAYARRGAPPMDFVIALDDSAMQDHPPWPGQPEQALWSYAPLAGKKKDGTNPGLLALQTLHSLRLRIELLVSLHARGGSVQDLRHDLRDLAHR